MNLRGSNRLQLLVLGAMAAGAFGPRYVHAADPAPVVGKSGATAGAASSPDAMIPPAPLPVSEGDAAGIRQVAQSEAAGNKKSEVMRQLELLYQQDGREMPDLNTDIRPVPVAGPNAAPSGPAPAKGPVATQPAATYAPPASNGLRTQQAAPAQMTPAVAPAAIPAGAAAAPPKSKYPVVSFFKKLVPGSKEKPTQAPPEYRPDVAPVPPGGLASQPPAQLRPEVQNFVVTTPTSAPGGNTTATLPLLDGQARSPFVQTAEVVPNGLPQPLAAINELPPAPKGELPSPDLPPLLAEPATDDSILVPPAAETGSPFTEMSEAEADKRLEMNPFTGLTLDEDSGVPSPKTADADKTPQKEETSPSATPGSEDPFADELKKMGIVPPGAEPKAEAKAEAPTLAPPASDTPTFDGIEDQATREKMKKIHERGSMKGLKGFCPVTLRDQRELKDAKPDFHSTFRGQKFHFADAEAKIKFDEEPARYAPAAYGADVVALTRDKDVIEGTLDFAAWFKGRLYLFGTQEAHDTFVANPALYATPVGIE